MNSSSILNLSSSSSADLVYFHPENSSSSTGFVYVPTGTWSGNPIGLGDEIFVNSGDPSDWINFVFAMMITMTVYLLIDLFWRSLIPAKSTLYIRKNQRVKPSSLSLPNSDPLTVETS